MSYRLNYQILSLPDNIDALPDYTGQGVDNKWGIEFTSAKWQRLYYFIESRLNGIGQWINENEFMQSDAGGETTKDNVLLLAQLKALYKGFDYTIEGQPWGLPYYRLDYDWGGYSDLLEALETSKWFKLMLGQGGFYIGSGLPCFFKICPSWQGANKAQNFLLNIAIPKLENLIKSTGKTVTQYGLPHDIKTDDYNWEVGNFVSVAGHVITFELWDIT